jgi:hypothetical protein
LCDYKPIPGRSPEEVAKLNRQMEKELERFREAEDCSLALSLRIPVAGKVLLIPIHLIRIGLKASPYINEGNYGEAAKTLGNYLSGVLLEEQAKKLSPKLALLHLPPSCFKPIIWNGSPDGVKQAS